MLTIYNVSDANNSILKRRAIDDYEIPQSLASSIEKLFGEPLTPEQAVSKILSQVRKEGDTALRKWSKILDGSCPKLFRVSTEEMEIALQSIDDSQRSALELSIQRVQAFHRRQPLSSWIMNDLGGTLGQLVRPIKRVGLYIPAGTAPLPSSVIMSAVPAQVAGVGEIVIVAPPEKKTGIISPIILATASMLGLTEVYTVGGAQAIAALAYGTESIPAVDKIFGPGNLFVTLAKKQVFGTVGIDNLAGPTETMVIADQDARPDWIAADMMAQAEHDTLASAILLTPSVELAGKVALEFDKQLPKRNRADVIKASITNRGGIVITKDIEEAVLLANAYGAEHLCLALSDPWRWVEKISSAGGIFIGENSFEVLGDYVAGPSHIMPTSGTARFASPVNVWDFVKLISLIGLDNETVLQIAPAAQILANTEGLDAHANAAGIRL